MVCFSIWFYTDAVHCVFLFLQRAQTIKHTCMYALMSKMSKQSTSSQYNNLLKLIFQVLQKVTFKISCQISVKITNSIKLIIFEHLYISQYF